MNVKLKDFFEIIGRRHLNSKVIVDTEQNKLRNQEMLYLFVSKQIYTKTENISSLHLILNEKIYRKQCNYSLNVRGHKFSHFPLDETILGRKLNYNLNNCKMDLFMTKKFNFQNLHFKCPRLFNGYLKFDKEKIYLNSSSNNFKLSLVDERFRFCEQKQHLNLEINLEKLGFTGKIYFKNQVFEYFRNFENFLKNFVDLNVNFRISEIFPFILLYQVDLLDFLTVKINGFFKKKISSSVLMDDLSFLSGFVDLSNLNVYPLMIFLEDLITNCNVDENTYNLYLNLGFLISVKKLNFLGENKELLTEIEMKPIKKHKSILSSIKNAFYSTPTIMKIDPKYNFPILQDSAIPAESFNRLSNKIVNNLQRVICEMGVCKESFMLILKTLKTYKDLGISLNIFFVQKVFTLFSAYENLVPIILMKLGLIEMEAINNFYASLTKLFCKELNKCLKENENIDFLYELFAKNFRVKNWIKFAIKQISYVHIKRIKKSFSIEELKLIKKSLEKCEKLFEMRDLFGELKLKEKVENLLVSGA